MVYDWIVIKVLFAKAIDMLASIGLGYLTQVVRESTIHPLRPRASPDSKSPLFCGCPQGFYPSYPQGK